MTNELFNASIGLSPEISSAIIGALAGGVLTYLGAIAIASRASLDTARADFAKIMMPYLAAIEKRQQPRSYENMIDSDYKQLIAAKHFSRALPWRTRRKFDKAWKEYYCSPIAERFPLHYKAVPNDDDINELAFKKAEARIRRLIDFT